MRNALTPILPLALAALCLTGCGSTRIVKVSPPAELFADCAGRAETTIEDALTNRAAIIACERDKNARGRAWAKD